MTVDVKNKHQCVAAMEMTMIIFGQGAVLDLRRALLPSGHLFYSFVDKITSDLDKSLESIISDSKKMLVTDYWNALDFFIETVCRINYLSRRLDKYDEEANKLSVWIQSFVENATKQGFRSIPLYQIYEILDTMKMRMGEENAKA